MAEEEIYKPVCVVVPEIELRNLCKLARESGEDLQAAARIEYPSISDPSSVRKLNRALGWAQMVIEAAAVVENILPENTNQQLVDCPSTTFDAETECCLLCGERH